LLYWSRLVAARQICRASALLLVLAPPLAHAYTRLSIELGGAVAASTLNPGYRMIAGTSSGLSVSASALRISPLNPMDSASGGSGGLASTAGSPPVAGIGVAELRPTALLEMGLLIGVGLRVGKAGFDSGSTALVGGDISLGLQHCWGRFIPFLQGTVGFNSYNALLSSTNLQRVTDLRVDAALGSRLYVSSQFFFSAELFAGYGDRFGGAVAFGGDIVQFRRDGTVW
jgi:hypothetical protein